eukprot:1144920-Pelagomonas_calceolata.AAC.1
MGSPRGARLVELGSGARAGGCWGRWPPRGCHGRHVGQAGVVLVGDADDLGPCIDDFEPAGGFIARPIVRGVGCGMWGCAL